MPLIHLQATLYSQTAQIVLQHSSASVLYKQQELCG